MPSFFGRKVSRLELDRALSGLTRIKGQDACAITPKSVDVWLHMGQEWIKLPDQDVEYMFLLGSDRSFCRMLLQNVFHLDEEQYRGYKWSIDHVSSDVPGLYTDHNGKYVVVARIPRPRIGEMTVGGLIEEYNKLVADGDPRSKDVLQQIANQDKKPYSELGFLGRD
jgi:hypothetical protein